MKRIIGLILILCLLLTLVPFTLAAGITEGTIDYRSGYDLASVRYQLPDGSYRFAEVTDTGSGYHYSFPTPEQPFTVKEEFFSLTEWDGAVDISWYDAGKTEFYLDTGAKLAGLAAIVSGQLDADTPDYRVKGDLSLLQSKRVENVLLVGAGGGNISDTVYFGLPENDFSGKTVYITTDLDMGGTANWTPIGGKYPMDTETTIGDPARDIHTIEAFFNGVLDGQGHRIENLFCNRYTDKGYAYSMAIGLVGYLGELYDGETSPVQAPAVRNLSVSGSVHGRRMVGGIVGRTGEIPTGIYLENCANYASVTNTDSKGVGGVVGAGWSTSGAIINCYNRGNVTTTYACPAGGICGSNSGLDIYCCYNTGSIDSNGNARARAIGCHDQGSYTVSDCFYLEGCDDDPASGGWYSGGSDKLTLSITAMTPEQLQSQALLDGLNCNGEAYCAVSGDYPVLCWEKDNTPKTATVTLNQPVGGSISAGKVGTLSCGTVIYLSQSAESGYAFRGFTANGEALSGHYCYVAAHTEISAVYAPICAGVFDTQVPEYCTLTVVKKGTAEVEGTPTFVENYPVQNGDALYEGDVLTATAALQPDAVPEDENLIYSGNFNYAFTYSGGTVAASNPDAAAGQCTVTAVIGTQSLTLRVEPLTTEKTWTQVADVAWYSQSEASFTLSTAQELAGLALLVKQGNSFAGKTVCLGADISLQNADGTSGQRRWNGIGTGGAPFAGRFDGQGHSITDMTAHSKVSGSGLFLACDGATVENVTVAGSAQAYSNSAGLVAALKNSTVRNCNSYAEALSTDGANAGGIAAQTSGSMIINCRNYGTVSGKDYVGGIAGFVEDGSTKLTDCVNHGAVTGDGSTGGVGGLVGRNNGALLRCANYGAVSASSQALGGAVGCCYGKDAALTDCYNIGSVKNSHTDAGTVTAGLIGWANRYRIENCFNYGAVIANASSVNQGAIFGKNGGYSTNTQSNVFYLDSSCAYADSGKESAADVQSVIAEAFPDILQTLNRNGCFVLKNDAYPELASAVLAQSPSDCVHNWDGGVIVLQPSEEYHGLKIFICSLCGAQQTQELARLSPCDGTDGCPCSAFSDTPAAGNWAHSGVDFALRQGLFTGISDTTFMPAGAMTRAMLVTVLWRLDGSPESIADNPFTDVPEGKWYTGAVLWAAQNGVVTGVGNARFDPNGNITREQLAAILYRYTQKKGDDTSKAADLTAFPDANQVSSWAQAAIAWANAEGLIAGNLQGGENCLLPKGNATRAQVAVILMRYLNTIKFS